MLGYIYKAYVKSSKRVCSPFVESGGIRGEDTGIRRRRGIFESRYFKPSKQIEVWVYLSWTESRDDVATR